MQYAPDINLLRTLDIKNQIGETFTRSESQAGQVEFVRITRRTDSRALLNLTVGLLQRINKFQCNFWRMLQIVLNRAFNIRICPLMANKLFHLLEFKRLLIPERSSAK